MLPYCQRCVEHRSGSLSNTVFNKIPQSYKYTISKSGTQSRGLHAYWTGEIPNFITPVPPIALTMARSPETGYVGWVGPAVVSGLSTTRRLRVTPSLARRVYMYTGHEHICKQATTYNITTHEL